ncbi:MAG TPA: S24 family peptidase [Candidatus Kapabacteria bacterium]|jgi:DNA polymerase V|nr:hypothetical protein [Ignavibacteria bacterium]HRI30422.1 S24 family peptidase [Candidatus Kapabacteria bacterium]HRK60372.1 S24 family peptidase [Candidatus Kapabacteria bacterium]
MKNEVGRRHKFVRETVLSMTVADYADSQSTTAAAVYAWEAGRRSVPHSVIESLATTHGISATWMLTGQGDVLSDRTQPKVKNKLDTVGELRFHLDAMQALLNRLDQEQEPQTENQPNNVYYLPMLSSRVSAGVPVGVEDAFEQVDLMEKLVEHKGSMCVLTVVGDSMKDAGICDGDMLIVDTQAEPKHGHIVIAKVYGELTVKRLLIQGKKKVLQAENPLFANIDITPHTDIEFIAVVKHCIKKL